MKKLFAAIFMACLTLSVNAQNFWNFAELSDADKAALDADAAAWTFDTEMQRYSNTKANLPQNATLQANGQELAITKGLLFTAPKANRIRLSIREKHRVLQLNGEGLTVTIPNLKKGQKLQVVAKTGKSSEAHGFKATNLKAEDGSFVESTEKLTNIGFVEADGDVTLTTTAGSMNIFRIRVTNK